MGYNLEQSTDYVNRESSTEPVRCRLCGLHSTDPCHDHPPAGAGMGCRQNKERGHFYEHPELDAPVPGPLNTLAAECHAANQHWWHHPATGERLDRNKGEMLMLIVSEVAEAMEGERKNLMDDKLPHRRMAEVELADVLIRVFDYAGAYGFDLDGAVAEKRAFNATRADHKPEARMAPGGKTF